jgi:hypothetical protein
MDEACSRTVLLACLAFSGLADELPKLTPKQWLQKLKAALVEALCTFARHPGNVAPLFDRLLRSVVVQPRSLQETSSLSRADISYQLNEIEVCFASSFP